MTSSNHASTQWLSQLVRVHNEDTCDMETMAAQYNTTLRKIMDDHAPEKTKTVKKKPAMPWYNNEIKGLKRDRRKAERQWLQHRGDPIKM